jgi:dihydrofolate reductase
MRKIIYYVATSIDGYIMGFDEKMDDFVVEGSGVEKYLSDLQNFDTVIMGRKTYEFGYKFGLQPGQAAYPNMRHHIFSSTLQFENADEKVKVCPLDLAIIEEIKNESGTDIYLCGGGEFAGWLLENEQIDILRFKLNPLILGEGIKLFGSSTIKLKTEFISQQTFDQGLQIIEYRIKY